MPNAYPEGIDVSHHQGHIDWPRVAASGVSFAFIKATQGNYFTDPSFERNRKAAREAGILTGFYHYFDPKVDSARQAHYFASVVGEIERGELDPMLDAEEAAGLSPNKLESLIIETLGTMYGYTGRNPGLYTYPDYWQNQLANSHNSTLLNYPLWIANYTKRAQPAQIGPWRVWSFWQYSSTQTKPGVVGRCDVNRFNGTPTNLRKFARLD